MENLEPLLPSAKPGGCPRLVNLREISNAIRYVSCGGIAWRRLPHDFPPWSALWFCFRTWRNDGAWENMHASLRSQVWASAGRAATLSAVVSDRRSVKTVERGAARR